MKNERPNIQLQFLVVVTGVILLIAKFAAYLLTHSNAILTDALESITNVIAGFIGLYSLQLSAKPRDEDHPYGHGKAEFISASVEGALVLFAGVFIFGKSIYSFFFPQHIEQLNAGIMILGITGVINFFLGYISERQGKKTDSPALIASGKHLKSDAASTAALLAALLLITLTGWQVLDNIIALGFGIFISVVGYRVLRRAVAGIMDEADYSLLKKIIFHLNEHRHAAWIDLHNMRVIKYGSMLHVDCHLTVPWYFNVNEAHAEVKAVNQEIEKSVSNPLEFFVHTDPCSPPVQCKLCVKFDCQVRQAAFEKKIEWNLDTSLRNKKHEL
jgi:cation diffusion facilitator family transporter